MQLGKKRILKLLPLFSCLLVLFLAACGGAGNNNTGNTSSGSKAPEDKQVLRYPVVGDVATLDPALVQDTDSNFPIQNIFTGLVALDVNLKVVDQLAASHSVSEDGLTWTFKLKPNLKFSNGDPLTANDVTYSIDRTLAPATKSQVSYYLSLIKDYDKITSGKVKTLIGTSLQAPDENTVVIQLSQPAAYFLQTLSYPTSYVVNRKVVEKYGARWTDYLQEGAGAGPWKMVSYSHQRGIELERNDLYYGPKPALKKMSILFFTDQVGMYKAYRANQLDYTPVPPANLATEQNKKEFRATPRLTIRYLTMNYLAKPFDNIKIRQAFALALNKDQIVQSALKGAFTPSNHIIPSGMPGYYEGLVGPAGIKATAGDQAKAKELFQAGLQESGYKSVADLPRLKLNYYPRNTSFKDAITVVQAQWKQVLGVTVQIDTVTRAKALELQNATKNNPNGLQIWQAGWNADYPDPQNWISTFFAKGSDYNQFNYGQNKSSVAAEQQAVQDTLAKADVEKDINKRLSMYNEAEQKIIDQVGWIPLWQEKTHSLTNAKLQNYVINAQDLIPPDDWSKIYMNS